MLAEAGGFFVLIQIQVMEATVEIVFAWNVTQFSFSYEFELNNAILLLGMQL